MKHHTHKIILSLFVLCAEVYAQELTEGYAPIRAMGMGGCSASVGNDENSVWGNPAGVARIRKARSRATKHAISFPNVIFGANSDAKSFNQSLKTAKTSDQDLASAVSELIENSDDLEDKAFWVRAALNPIGVFEIGKTPTAIGMFSNTHTKLYLDKDSPESARVEVISDSGANIGLSSSNRTNLLNFGLHVRPTYRYSFDDKVDVATLVDTQAFKTEVEGGSNKAFGLGLDAGFLWTMADFWYPTIGVTIKNLPTGCQSEYLNPFSETRQKVCGTTYTSGTVKNEEALSVVDPTDNRVGLSISPRLSRDLGMRLAVEMHHLHFANGESNYGLEGVEPLKKIHGGLELFLGTPLEVNPISARVGINQGFITTGFTLRSDYLTFEFASYGQDISYSQSPREDRRYLGSFSFNF